ncbi:DNA polymerase III subunit gamma/tau [Ferrimonas balearica]|uniref:DNA polymerase III subunit gamma/tau n=1 Tax=Ferrimonas balearica TaxID=44012 RepID=UPI001C99E4FC|nr:DNA polymerase III subunit gamma/tau [Ferrimonas balearica]MBY5921140.1 DNA polymerase III subunit gamma/tau [Ferrimonas balearica]MBY5996175.1 DNA polymerase III subunit gamma/tau [Ferrimonas balearica]
MSYQVLARKWRPASFDQVVGQEHVLKALTHALEQNRLHHAYLFTGTRGVGKTSIARLLAKGLNCETGITATPCGQCNNCREISEGRFVDLLEIDAASRTKVDDTREILDNVQYQPVRGRFKVYLIDEVHMLSRHSFNALLKTLEEPPPHVKFLLATTDPQKLPVTVLSRCLQFNLKSVPVGRISAHLAKVLDADQVPYEPAALDLLAQAADGSVRDGMSLTDQAIAHGGGQLGLASVQAMLGTLDNSYALRLLKGLSQGEVQALMGVLDEVEAFAPDHDDLLKQMSAMLHQVALCQFNVRAADLSDQGGEVQALAQALDREQVQLWYQMLTQGRQDLALAPDPRSGFEMVLLRALAFAPLSPAPPMAAPQPQLGAVSAPATVVSESAPKAAPVQPAPTASVATPTEATKPEVTKPEAVVEPAVSADASAVDESDEDEQALADEQNVILAQAEGARVGDTSAAAAPAPRVDTSADAQAMAAEQAMILAQADSQRGDEAVETPASAVEDEDDEYRSMMDSYAAFAAQSEGATDVEHAPMGEPSPQLVADAGIQGLLEQALSNHRNLQTRLDAAQEGEVDPKPETVSQKGTAMPTERPQPQAESSGAATEAPQQETPPPSPAQTTAVAPAVAEPQVDDDPPPWVVDDAPRVSGPAQKPTEIEPTAPAVPVAEVMKPAAAPVAEAVKPVTVPQMQAATAPASQASGVVLAPKRAVASNETDAFWYQTMAQLGIGARPRQLAINSVMERDGNTVQLHLRSEQRHLNSESVIAPLKESMERAWGESIELKIVEDPLPGRETPLEIRRRLHQERLVQARDDLLQDPVVQWLQSEFDARLIEESVSYQNPG